MPRLPGVDAEIQRRGGISRYRTISKGGKYFHIAITPRGGPRGGHSLAIDAPKRRKDPGEGTAADHAEDRRRKKA